MKSIFYPIVLLVIYSLIFSACANRHSRPFSRKDDLNAKEQAGETVFMENCHRCHPQGEAGLGPAIHWAPDFAKRFQVRHGVGVMPEFNEEEITEKELDQLMAYLKAVKSD